MTVFEQWMMLMLQMSGFRATKSGDAYRLEQKFEEVSPPGTLTVSRSFLTLSYGAHYNEQILLKVPQPLYAIGYFSIRSSLFLVRSAYFTAY